MNKRVAIDCITESSKSYSKEEAVIVIDVIRSTTVAATVVETGRRCFFASTVEDALVIARQLNYPLLMGEIGGNMPYGFDLKNSPVDIQKRRDVTRPIVLVSSSGIPLLASLKNCQSAFVACIRNWKATVTQIASHYNQIDVLAAPTRGEFREEDKLCSAWIAADLINHGYECADNKTKQIVDEWRNQTVDVCSKGNSAKYLRDTGQEKDLEFILNHINDFNYTLIAKDNEITKLKS
jgi:phosphosulfolactate phosphohydrolase-like enzyme